MTDTHEANRVIDAHLRAAERHIERGELVKAEQHLVAATTTSEAAGIPHWGRYSLQQITRRRVTRAQRQTERAILNRERLP